MTLVLAISLICIAHIVRTLRWELFVKTYEKPNTKNLLQSLSIGYFINSFIPFKAGDLVRAWISGRKMKNGRGFALATVIVDRYLDILVVGILFAIFSAFRQCRFGLVLYVFGSRRFSSYFTGIHITWVCKKNIEKYCGHFQCKN